VPYGAEVRFAGLRLEHDAAGGILVRRQFANRQRKAGGDPQLLGEVLADIAAPGEYPYRRRRRESEGALANLHLFGTGTIVTEEFSAPTAAADQPVTKRIETMVLLNMVVSPRELC